MNNFAITLLRDPSAVVELFAAFFAAVYLLQLLLQQRAEVFQVVETRPLSVRRPEPSLFNFGSSGLGKPVSKKAMSKKPVSGQIALSAFGRLGTRQDVENFHRVIFHDLSDSGSLFPRSRQAGRKNDLRLYGVGSYVSSNKQSLRKSSAKRLRLPE